jgi:hypothetical protein
VRYGAIRKGTTIDEQIGPVQIEGDRVWFGKTFYDGEGNTGIGGFGYFDAGTRTYKLFSPPELADWSVSAILVDPRFVWLGLVDRGEGAEITGGLLRFDRESEEIKSIKFPDIVSNFIPSGGQIVIATDYGFALISGNRLQRYVLDCTSDGRLQIVPTTTGNSDLLDARE